jgi:hypothetical protein
LVRLDELERDETVTLSAQDVAAFPPVKPKRKPRVVTTRYGAMLRFDVTPAIGRSVARMSPKNGPMTQSAICRMAMHAFCLANDKVYAQEMQSGEADA